MAKMGSKEIKEFNFSRGAIIANKYEVFEKLGSGWEGEVYRVIEIESGVERAAKFYFPKRNPRNKVASRNAMKLHKLSYCPIIIRYHTQEIIKYKQNAITCVVSEYFDGEILSEFLEGQQGKRISVMQGLILLHNLASGLETMHRLGEYHGDLHSENILIKRYGLGFELKLLDLHHWGDSKKANIEEDICNSIRIFYDAIGGSPRYAKQPIEVKEICLGLKKSLILKKFRSAAELKKHIENINWQSSTRV
ncbi:MAG: protein kinase [Bdellovibrionota bacterium]